MTRRLTHSVGQVKGRIVHFSSFFPDLNLNQVESLDAKLSGGKGSSVKHASRMPFPSRLASSLFQTLFGNRQPKQDKDKADAAQQLDAAEQRRLAEQRREEELAAAAAAAQAQEASSAAAKVQLEKEALKRAEEAAAAAVRKKEWCVFPLFVYGTPSPFIMSQSDVLTDAPCAPPSIDPSKGGRLLHLMMRKKGFRRLRHK